MSKKISAHNATVISKQKAPGVNVTQSTVAEGVTVTMTHIDVPTTFIFDVENANITTAYKFTLDITNSANVRYAIRILASTTFNRSTVVTCQTILHRIENAEKLISPLKAEIILQPRDVKRICSVRVCHCSDAIPSFH